MVDIFADVPEAYTRDNMHPDLREKLGFMIDQSIKILNSKVTMITDDNKFVELSEMRKNDEHLLIHLVNYDVTVDGDITPANNIKVQIAIPENHKISRISYSGTLGQMEQLDFKENDDGTVLVQFPALNIYGLARIELM